MDKFSVITPFSLLRPEYKVACPYTTQVEGIHLLGRQLPEHYSASLVRRINADMKVAWKMRRKQIFAKQLNLELISSDILSEEVHLKGNTPVPRLYHNSKRAWH